MRGARDMHGINAHRDTHTHHDYSSGVTKK